MGLTQGPRSGGRGGGQVHGVGGFDGHMTGDAVTIKEEEQIDIPEWQQKIVLDRLNNQDVNLSEEEFYKKVEAALHE